MRVGVVGSGLSGLLCAQRLTELVPGRLQISVLEWGRGPGGRTARRRVTLADDGGNTAELSFDHAAPYFSATTPAFRGLLARWQAVGVAAPWPAAGEDIWVGTPANNAIARHLVTTLEASGASMLFGHHVLAAQHDGAAWQVRATDRATDATAELTFDALVLSDKLLLLPNTYTALAPAEHGPLALPLSLASTGVIVMLIALRRNATAAAPSETAVADYTRAAAAGGGGEKTAHRIIAKVVHDSAKPGRPGWRQSSGGGGAAAAAQLYYDQWVVHSTAEYATAHLVGESLDDEAAVLAEMQSAFLAGGEFDSSEDLVVAHASVMAWDHAQTAAGSCVADAAYRLDPERRAGVCGDFFGERVQGAEAAALSGIALGEALAPLCHGKSEL